MMVDEGKGTEKGRRNRSEKGHRDKQHLMTTSCDIIEKGLQKARCWDFSKLKGADRAERGRGLLLMPPLASLITCAVS